MEITYQSIKPLIKKEELVNGNQIHLEFCAKNQETPTQTVAVVMSNESEIKKNVTKQVVKSTIKNTIINQIFNLLGIRGIGRNLISSSANDILNKNQNTTSILNTDVTPKKKEKAIVDAFKGIMSIYKYNEQNAEWKYVM